jgi:hypothetical protein
MNSDEPGTPRSSEEQVHEHDFPDWPDPKEQRRETEQRERLHREYRECFEQLVWAYINQSPLWEEVMARYAKNNYWIHTLSDLDRIAAKLGAPR